MAAISATLVGAALGSVAARTQVWISIGRQSKCSMRDSRNVGYRSPILCSAVEPSEKNLDIMRKFSEQYARRSGTFFCVDKGVTSVVIKGLAEHKDSLGAPLCPCRHYDDKQAEVEQGFWNCPCVPMRERKECHCMLFLTADNDFAGEEQTITIKEIKELTANV